MRENGALVATQIKMIIDHVQIIIDEVGGQEG
jgi:hypothetical protein